jgi:hypothetical protein
MRRPLLVTLLLVLLAGSARPGDAPADPQVQPLPPILRSDDQPAPFSVTVLDAATGRPLAGAVVRGYAERVDGRAVAVNALLVTLHADASGLAVGALDTKALGASHWTVHAKGHRPFARYTGFWPPERVDLAPSVPMAVGVLDPWGRPLAGARVQGFSGCPHAPSAIRGVTGKDGVFRVEDGGQDGLSLWVLAPGCARRVGMLRPVWGDEPDDRLLAPGLTVRGRLRDAAGRPLAGAVVRAADYPRGPATCTDDDGRFVLDGLEPTGAIQVFHPTLEVEDESVHVVERAAADVPLDLTWTRDGFGAPAQTGRLLLRARDGAGHPAAALALLVLGADGRGWSARTDANGLAHVEVPAGAVRVRGDDPFAPFDVREAKATVLAQGETTVDLVLAPRPRLRVAGTVPEDLSAGVVACGRTAAARGACLPAGARAVVVLEDEEGTWARPFPVGPETAGVRTARVQAPAAHRIRLAADDSLDDVPCSLRSRDHPRVGRRVRIVDGVITLRRGGRFLLRVGGSRDVPARLVPVDLPPLADGAVEKTIDLAREGRPDRSGGPARLLVSLADGSPVPALEVVSGPWATSESDVVRHGATSPVEVWAPCRVLLSGKGLRPLQVDVARPGDRRVVFPAGGLDLATVDASGAAVPSAVLVDGVVHDAPKGRLVLRGFAPGRHAVVVQRTSGPPGPTGSVRWRFELTAGQVVKKTLAVP